MTTGDHPHQEPAGHSAPHHGGLLGRVERQVQERGRKNASSTWATAPRRLLRPAGVVLLIAFVLLSMLPGLPSRAAAPPENAPEAIAAVDVLAETGETDDESHDPDAREIPTAPDQQDGGAETSSVRLRGLEAPVELRQSASQGGDGDGDGDAPARAASEQPDPGDGPVSAPDRRPRERASDRAELPSRVWPMPRESYTFTQQFGCVPQLGNLYFPGDGCPASAPAIHTGIDLAAPEGTPFYSAASGWVTLADYDRPTADANTRIAIQHDGRNEDFATDYLHWVASYVEEGDYVRAGEPIGEVGNVGFSTGPHLHFSVTDLNTGEHIDPMRWLPEASGPADYPRSTLPRASMRLPAGTTAGQPESADPTPPRPAVRQDVPDTPTDAERGPDRSQRQRERDARRADRSATDGGESDTSRRERVAESDTDTATSPDDTTVEPRAKERERHRERSKDGTDTETADSGKDGEKRKNADESSDTSADKDRRNDRAARDDSSSGGKADRGNRDGGKNEDSGGRGGRDGKDGKDGKDGANGGAGENGSNGEDGGTGDDGGNGGNGGNGGSGGSGDEGGNGGDGGDGGNGSQDGAGGNGGNGGDGGDGTSGPGGDGGNGGGGGDGTRGGNGGDGGDGGSSSGNPDGDGSRGGDGGSGGSGGAGIG